MSLVLELSHSATAHAKASDVWAVWTDVSNWNKWDGGLEVSKLLTTFEKGGNIMIKPHGSEEINLELIEVVANEKFADVAKIGLGTITTSHVVEEKRNRVTITHSVKFEAHNPKTLEIFYAHIWPNMEAGFPEGVKALASLAEQLAVKV